MQPRPAAAPAARGRAVGRAGLAAFHPRHPRVPELVLVVVVLVEVVRRQVRGSGGRLLGGVGGGSSAGLEGVAGVPRHAALSSRRPSPSPHLESKQLHGQPSARGAQDRSSSFDVRTGSAGRAAAASAAQKPR